MKPINNNTTDIHNLTKLRLKNKFNNERNKGKYALNRDISEVQVDILFISSYFTVSYFVAYQSHIYKREISRSISSNLDLTALKKKYIKIRSYNFILPSAS